MKVKCNLCNGTGSVKYSLPWPGEEKCIRCSGNGYVNITSPIRRITHSVFRVIIPEEQKDFALGLANHFIQWLTSQTDVYLRLAPEVVTKTDFKTHKRRTELRFRAGLDRNPNQKLPGTIQTSDMAWVEVRDES